MAGLLIKEEATAVIGTDVSDLYTLGSSLQSIRGIDKEKKSLGSLGSMFRCLC